MASSSSNDQWIYDVFINFRGEDTRQSFVSHLYAALSTAGINAFLDDEKLKKGFELGPELLRGIEGSRISLVVLSPNYASSRWCLDELIKIMECRRKYGQLVIPIFYNVDPSHVRRQVGAFHLTARDAYVGLSWKNALTKVGGLSGWDLSKFRNEGDLVKIIVEDVWSKLDYTFLSITEFPVGLESRVQEVTRLVGNQTRIVRMVGIWGMGGSGKTTTAKAIFNQIHLKFMCRSFIENIREVCESDSTRGLINLQEQLLSDVLKTKEKIHSISMGTAMVEKRLKSKRALIILDDVTTSKQLKALCGNHQWFGSGSVIIVTTRDVRLLKSLKVDNVYKMEEMNQTECLELFSWHAFGEASPRKNLIGLSTNVVAYCGGLPLALEVLGSYLNEREELEWKSVLSKLERIPNDQVQEKLRISYDGLKDELEKDIFLDICCFFIGKGRVNVTDILNGCGLHADIGITILIERSLIKVDKNNKLRMHDLVRDMGREIVRECSTKDPGKRSRLWFHEDVHDVLTKYIGTETVEGLILKLQNTGRVCFSANAFKEMRKLRLLQLDCVDLTGDFGHLSHELKWVYWKGFTSTYLPNHFYQGNLVVLELKYSSIKRVWKETKLLVKLKILNLSHSKYLVNTPDFSKLPNLEKLILKDCPSLFELHHSIGDLRNLLLINLEDCTNLNNLPGKTYQLKSVKTLILSGCSKIDKLEEDIVQMESLTTLIAKDTAIKEVPYSILGLKNIGYISLCGYEGLSRDVFPSLFRSWISPTMNPLSRIPLFAGMSLPLVSMDIQNYSSGNLSSWLGSLSKLRSVWIQCHSEIQLTQESRRILDDQYDVNSMDLEASSSSSSYASQISDFSLKSLLIRLGSCHTVLDTLANNISQGLTTNDSSNFFLPGGNYPSWLAYKGEGPSVHFQVPEDCDCCLKGIVLCVVYSSTPENIATECLTSVMINNRTKFTIQIYKQDTVMSFNDEDWESVKSNLDPGDNMEIVVSFGRGLTVKETAVYLINAQSITMEIEPSPEVNMQPSPSMKMEPSPKPTKHIFTRLAKRIRKCSCLNQLPIFHSSKSMAYWSDEENKPKCIYDVFINFRGEDTRRNLVSHLYASLSNAGAYTFLDNETFPKGMELGPELLRAIEASRVSIVVFSENYTDSNWCLIELCKIMECHRDHDQVVLPIFYGIDPSVVRHQKGAFGKALQASAVKIRTGEDMSKLLSSWRSALTDAANLSGWDVTDFRSESELVKKIVENVLTKLDVTLLSITDFPVGLESRVQEVIEYIESQSSKVCMVGIWGMGGLGKTTTAKAIYNQIHRRFEDRSFIENIRKVCENNSRGHMHLQEQFLSDVVKTKVKKIRSISTGTTMIKKRLSGRRALVVLDDVTTFEQLKALCGNRKWFGQGSVIIVTTRDVRVLSLLKVDYVYKMEEMDEDESLELFSWHAFGEASPREDLIELSRNVVAYCGGLPLALEVLGSYLYERTEQEWKSVLLKLKRIPNDQVQEKLRISYDGLKDDMERDIFLDICCFFIGKNRADAADILNGCGLYADIGITVLIERSLVKVGKNNKIQMHDLLRDMGREIVRGSSAKDPGKRSRLWFHEDVHDVLTKNTGTETIEGLVLKLQKTGRVCFSANAFKEMRKLRLLQLDCVDLSGDYGHLSQELRWVYWQGFTLKYIPDDLYQGNLVVIDLKYSSIKQVWKETKLLEKLKILNLSHSRYLENTPDFSKLPNLEKLILKDCPNLSELHQSIGDLTNLLLINLKDCTSLRNLPRKIYQLKSLTTLILSGCSKIDKLEEDIVQMESLTTLIAKDTAIKEVPYSILRLKSIGYISLCGYEGLTRDVFPSLIRSWMSPTMNPLSRIPQFGGMSLALVSNSGNVSSWLSSLSKLRSVWIQCHSEIQVTQESRRIIDDQYDAKCTELETTSSYAAHISSVSLRSLLIRLGSCDTVIDTLGKSISQGLTTNDSSNFFLPCDNYPSWLAYKGEGPSVNFQVPEDRDCCLKGIVLCAVYSPTPGNMATECLTSVLVINYTKFTIQVYKQDTVISFNDEDWESVISNLDPGDNMEIVVAYGCGLTVKETAVYLIYGPSITMKVEPSITMQVELELSVNVKMEASPEVNLLPSLDVKMESSPEVNMQPSPRVNMLPSPNMKMDPSTEMNMQPSPNVKLKSSPNRKMEPSPKPNKNFLTRLAKRMGECSCLNQT
ncbi:uncharacterized protein LOC130743576 [Lotus japonicus]|uniref:uncharacterized protein LOC130743576 n=1 Tax=Lotus japonicus TaxID=34305 RepID=UPI0025847661|nr:uncharacterized protein LOC130743576 [Lotus japonicus]